MRCLVPSHPSFTNRMDDIGGSWRSTHHQSVLPSRRSPAEKQSSPSSRKTAPSWKSPVQRKTRVTNGRRHCAVSCGDTANAFVASAFCSPDRNIGEVEDQGRRQAHLELLGHLTPTAHVLVGRVRPHQKEEGRPNYQFYGGQITHTSCCKSKVPWKACSS